ncbi:myelin P2 protein-like isoform X4 [Rhinatrema bivittatum]|nr:myelin P2 protein-like isoform X4 [Rhinatrema bivittatum]XP_029447408.1 myelin P2 protein-like isoform X4 [Rhinatrema bivittatum]XP_029447409.1 myelin P2 protein-like isoform X4 [Rhinatrema bivittatum]
MPTFVTIEEFFGTWRLISSENFDEYLTQLGNDVLTRKMGCATKPDLMISKDGDRFTVKVKSTFLNSEMDFLLGEEFEEHTADSRKTWTVVTFNDGVLSQVQKWNGKESTIKKELENGQLKETSVIGDVTCIRIYEKL